VKHVAAIAGREIRSFFLSPVAYVVLTLWSFLAGVVFLSGLVAFQEQLFRAQQFQAFDFLREMNLNDHVVMPFLGTMWIVLLFLVPAVTMGLFANEKSNGTDELLLTSPVTIWEIVLGKFLAGSTFALLMTAILSFFPVLLFYFGEPEVGKTAAGLLGILLVSLAYVAVGAFASSVTRNQLIAFILSMVLLLVFGLMLPYLAGETAGVPGLSELMQWVSTAVHFENLLKGLVETRDLAYFAVVIGIFLLLSKAAVESIRWR